MPHTFFGVEGGGGWGGAYLRHPENRLAVGGGVRSPIHPPMLREVYTPGHTGSIAAAAGGVHVLFFFFKGGVRGCCNHIIENV